MAVNDGETGFSTQKDEQLAKQLWESIEAQWKEWQMELLVLANNQHWDALKELIMRGPSGLPHARKNQVVI